MLHYSKSSGRNSEQYNTYNGNKYQHAGRNKPHIDFIDLAKGLCILLVLTYHVDEGTWIYSNEKVNNFFFSFRIPLYFILSGLFISYRQGYKMFVIKKINRLVIPFCFFYLLTCIYALMMEGVNAVLLNGGEYKSIYDLTITNFIIDENPLAKFPNNPIWFLVSLFTTYMFYSLFHKVFKGNETLIFVASFLMGVIGYTVFAFNINLPLYFDTSLTCMPFVAIGTVIRKRCQILSEQKRWISITIFMVSAIITFALSNGTSEFYANRYECNIAVLYICGIFGACAILYMSKAIGYIPVINYIGRYSIIVLGTHYLFFQMFRTITNRLSIQSIPLSVTINITGTVICSIIAIYLLRKFLPYFVAQKDLVVMKK